MSNEDEDRATEARRAINALEAELEKEKEAEEEKENREQMSSRIAHMYEHHVRLSRFEGLMDRLYKFHQRPSTTGIISVGLLCLLIGLGLTSWSDMQTRLGSTELVPIATTTTKPTSTIADMTVANAQACLYWCLKRELLVTRVMQNGCECVDEHGEAISMVWAYRKDWAEASNKEIEFSECIERRVY